MALDRFYKPCDTDDGRSDDPVALAERALLAVCGGPPGAAPGVVPRQPVGLFFAY